MAGTKTVSLLLVFIVVAAPMATDAAMNCGTVVSLLQSCVKYLQGSGPLPTECCSGVKSLNAQANNPGDRQIACGCIKAAAVGVNPNLAAGLPGKCGVNIPYQIGPSTDCSKIR